MNNSIPQDYIPNRGDVIYINFTPQAGNEQKGWRPVVVVSPYQYHCVSNTAILCPITSNISPWAWKVILPDTEIITGAVLVDQCTSRDYRARGMRYHGTLSQTICDKILALLATLVT